MHDFDLDGVQLGQVLSSFDEELQGGFEFASKVCRSKQIAEEIGNKSAFVIVGQGVDRKMAQATQIEQGVQQKWIATLSLQTRETRVQTQNRSSETQSQLLIQLIK